MTDAPSSGNIQALTVQAPEFTIDPAIIQGQFPPDTYEQQMSYLVLSDPALSWERALVPGDGHSDSTQAFDWEVKGSRRDQPPLDVEPSQQELGVCGFGPYTCDVPNTEQQISWDAELFAPVAFGLPSGSSI
jgi:hypothetical protein